VNTERYIAMLQNFFAPALQDSDDSMNDRGFSKMGQHVTPRTTH
jgi:hypothetical protein